MRRIITTTAVPRFAGLYDDLLRDAGGRVVDAVSTEAEHGVRVSLYESGPYDLHVPALAIARLSINLRQAPVHGALSDDRPRDYSGRRYSLFLTPPAADAWWRKPAPSRHINVYFDPKRFDELHHCESGRLLVGAPLIDAAVPAFRPWIDALEQAVTAATPIAAEAAASLAGLILAELSTTSHRRDVLSAAALKRLEEFVAANLGAPLRVAELAKVAGMQPGLFGRALRASLGTTPHRFVLHRRLERARQLLLHTRHDIADIAANCGFSSQQHLNNAMRAVLGVTPGGLRRG